MQVDLIYLSPNPYGGWVTYTSHLMKSLRAVGITPNLFKVRERSERTERPFGYGEKYRNISLDELLYRGRDGRQMDRKMLIVAAAKNFKELTEDLVYDGTGLVVHDPTELKNLPGDVTTSSRVIVVRKTGLEHLPKATFIRHPYVRVANPESVERTKNAISICRVDFDKHTDILLDANRLLPEDKRISIRGFENRIYTRFKIVPNYPEWQQSIGHFPREEGEAFKLLQQHTFAVDMSEIKGDGGGTQYSFLEAWDAGCINVINRKWLREGDDMQDTVNCLASLNSMHLAGILNMELHEGDLSRLRNMGYAQLALHHPVKIGNEYKEFIKRL
jgi:hypothetical protein